MVMKTVSISLQGRSFVSGVQRLGRRVRGLVMLVAAGVLAACATSSGASDRPAVSDSRSVRVVAAENFWGSLAAQLGGSHAQVSSIIDNPNADPHDYEPTGADARLVAGAQLALVNGIGYDSWASKLIAANPVSGREVLTVGDVVGVGLGGNPHRWYSPTDVRRVIDAITAAYKRLDPADAGYFDRQHATVVSQTLRDYFDTVTAIRERYAGTPVGASESIFAPLAQALGLRLLTPESFLDAISEGSDPTAADKALIDRQIQNRQIQVYVYNSQNATPDVQAQLAAARKQHIAVATVTETLTPAGASFQTWQVRQLRNLQAALAAGTGR
jgi:zinc/manganese transport system substrate-binding protein